MTDRRNMDAFGAVSLTGFALLLAFNQVVIKVTNDGLQPIFFAALRSAAGAVLIYLWIRWRGIPLKIAPGTLGPGLLIGAIFAVEFICLFLALDLTTVTRTSVIFYTMPMWLALMAHVLIPGERLTRLKAMGLVLAFAGVVVALTAQGGADGTASILGDLLALCAAITWAAIAICARATSLKTVRPELQLLWQLTISAPILMLAAPFFGDFLRDPTWVHWAGLGFQSAIVVSAGFLFWLWLLSIYPASSVAAFSFLSPVFGVALGWFMLGEEVGPRLFIAMVLVCAGLVAVNRPPRQVPQKV